MLLARLAQSSARILARRLAATLFEQRCTVCGKVHPRNEQRDQPVCPDCLAHLQPRTGGYCPACGEPFADPALPLSLCGLCLKEPPPWISLTTCGIHEGLLRELVLRAKFRHDLPATRCLGNFLAAQLLRCPDSPFNSSNSGQVLLVPMPLHSSRLRQRGNNQCMLLAAALLAGLKRRLSPKNLPRIAPEALVRTRVTPTQRGLDRKSRQQNVHHAFAASPVVSGRIILLLDDVLTTGATMRQATQTLLQAGALRVHCAAIARAYLGAR